MRVLRLGNSDDLTAGIPDESRAWRIAGELLAEAAGEPVETIVKPIWPEPELPGLVGGWLDEYEPDLVFLKVTWFWYGYESVPRRLERLLGPVFGKPLAKGGLAAAGNPRLAHNRAFKLGRRAAHRVIGGDTPFNSHHVLEVMEACIRRVVAKESIGLVVKGTGSARHDEGALSGFYDRFTERRHEVEGGIERLCKQLGVVYIGGAGARSHIDPDLLRGDGLHKGPRGHAHVGAQEGAAMVRGWQQMRA